MKTSTLGWWLERRKRRQARSPARQARSRVRRAQSPRLLLRPRPRIRLLTQQAPRLPSLTVPQPRPRILLLRRVPRHQRYIAPRLRQRLHLLIRPAPRHLRIKVPQLRRRPLLRIRPVPRHPIATVSQHRPRPHLLTLRAPRHPRATAPRVVRLMRPLHREASSCKPQFQGPQHGQSRRGLRQALLLTVIPQAQGRLLAAVTRIRRALNLINCPPALHTTIQAQGLSTRPPPLNLTLHRTLRPTLHPTP